MSPREGQVRLPEKPWWWPTLAGAVQGCVWLYVLAVLAVWLLLRFAGDRWWLATVMLFGPRWIYGLPLALLVPAAALVRHRLLLPLAACAIVVVGPIAGLCLPLGRLLAPAGPAVRVLACNVDGSAVDPKMLSRLIEDEQPDVVALQECWGGVQYRWPAGWYVRQQGGYWLRHAIRSAKRRGVWSADWACLATSEPVSLHHFHAGSRGHFCCVHMPSPHYGARAGTRPIDPASSVQKRADR